MIPKTAKIAVFLHLPLFYDSYDSKRRFLLASTRLLWLLRQLNPWSSSIFFCFMIPTTAKSVVFLHLFLFFIPTTSKSMVFLHLLLFYDSYDIKGIVFFHLLLFFDSYDSQKRGVLASTFYDSYDSKRRRLLASTIVLWFLRQQKAWSSCIYPCLLIPATAKKTGLLASTLVLWFIISWHRFMNVYIEINIPCLGAVWILIHGNILFCSII